MKNRATGLCLALFLSVSTAVILVTNITGCAGDRYNRSTGQYIDDKSLNMRVKNALNDSLDYKFSDVTVNAYRGTVELNGFVDNSEQKRRAEELVEHIQGVREVKNNISVKENRM